MADEEITEQPVKRKPGRPKGSKDSRPRNYTPRIDKKNALIDPKTGIVIQGNGANARIMGRIGDEKVTKFVQYHMDCLKMRQGVDRKNVIDLYNRFYKYLAYCAEHGILPNNMNAYLAIGISKDDIRRWSSGEQGTPEHKQFARDVKDFFASIHEQGGMDGMFNPILSIFWSKAHDGMIEASKVEVTQNEPLGERKSAEEIAKTYADLPD